MKWAWPRTARDDAPRIQPGDAVVRCPQCSTDLPAVSVVALRSHAVRGGELVRDVDGKPGIVSGDIVCCQSCALVYAIGPHGVFKRDPKALPYVGAVTVPNGDTAQPVVGPPGAQRERPLTPLARPAV